MSTLYVISAPSGGGKTSLVYALLAKEKNIELSVSFTTRPKRPNEKSGKSYAFVTEAEFNRLVMQDIFLEHATVFGYQYGTSVEWVEKTLALGRDVILEIDWQGAMQVKQKMPECVLIFIVPPSITTLKKRLLDRGQDSKEVIARRLQAARTEIAHYSAYDYLIVNRVFEEALVSLQAIIQTRRLRVPFQQKKYKRLLEKLVSEEHSS